MKPKYCRDCGIEISEHAFHTGHETWCEDCFDIGLKKDMDDHFLHTVKTEMEEENETKES
jgi:hypothetical protein